MPRWNALDGGRASMGSAAPSSLSSVVGELAGHVRGRLLRRTRQARGKAYAWHWRVRDRLEGFGLDSALRALNDSERWPRALLEAHRDQKLRSLVAHAYARVPAYRELMRQRDVTPEDIRGAIDLPRLPILTKDDLRRFGAGLRAQDVAADALEVARTGGTTGAPMEVVRDRERTAWQRGCYWRGFGWGGLTLETPWVQLFGGSLGHGDRPGNRLKNAFAGKLFLPAYELSASTVAAYVHAIKASGARHLVGYASACAELARLTEKAGLHLRLDAVFPTAEVLAPAWRDVMMRVFGAVVLPYYGCGEVQSLGYTCPEAARLGEPVYHSCDEHAIIEVEPAAGGPATLTGDGAFLVTDLDNFAMPLIRYRNGDAGRIAAPGCVCGRTLGKIERVDGRVTDVLLTTGGEIVSGTIGVHAFKFVRGVEGFQIVQRQPGEVVVRMVCGTGYDASAEELRLARVFTQHLGAQTRVAFDYIDSLPRTRAGKARVVINEWLEGRGRATPPERLA